VANHNGPNIDFSTLHAWPDNWLGFADYSPANSNQVRRRLSLALLHWRVVDTSALRAPAAGVRLHPRL